MSYIGKKPVDFNDVTEAQTFNVTDSLTVSGNILLQSEGDELQFNTSSSPVNKIFSDDTYTTNGLTISADNGVALKSASNHLLLDDTGTNEMVFNVDSGERMRITSSGVGIGTSSPDNPLHISSATEPYIRIENTDTSLTEGQVTGGIIFEQNDSTAGATGITGRIQMRSVDRPDTGTYFGTAADMDFLVSGSSSGDASDNASKTAMTIGAGTGNVLVGTADSSQFNNSGAGADTGIVLAGTSYIDVSRVSNPMLYLNRCSTDGEIINFSKDGTTAGSISTYPGSFVQMASAGDKAGILYGTSAWYPIKNGVLVDNTVDAGGSAYRFRDVYSAGGVTTTSDANEKQQIDSLTDTEITAAKAISKLFKTFKWNDSVESKGDNARTHTGHIAQEVQQAMTDAGLDAADYAFWCSNTWWETQTDVPAVAAVAEVLDDDGNVVTEAVEAKDAYTRVDTYDTQADAPAGATERTRLGLRYAELLAFVGAATEQRLTHLETLEARIAALENV